MTFDEYQAQSKTTVVYPNPGKNFVYPAFGVAGEAGEIADIAKRIVRDKAGQYDEHDRQNMKGEIGDLLWYAAQLATEFELPLDEIAIYNIQKLAERRESGKLRRHK